MHNTCWLLLLLPNLAMSWQAEWIQLPSSTRRIHPRRSGHTAFGPYVFGGYLENDNKERYVSNDLWQFVDNEWRNLEQTGDIPGPRLVSTASVVGNQAYLFGGWDPQTAGTGGVILDDVHVLDLSTLTWIRLDGVPTPDGPTSRLVSVTLPDQRILLHNHRCRDFVYIFDCADRTFVRQATTGVCPSARGLHTATLLVGDDRVVLFGGAAQDGTMSNEAFVLDTRSWEWSLLSCGSLTPTPRAAPCLVTLDESHVLLFGGAQSDPNAGLRPCGDTWILNVNSSVWDRLEVSNGPAARNAATMHRLDDHHSSHRLLLAGGWHPFHQTYDDCYVLQLKE